MCALCVLCVSLLFVWRWRVNFISGVCSRCAGIQTQTTQHNSKRRKEYEKYTINSTKERRECRNEPDPNTHICKRTFTVGWVNTKKLQMENWKVHVVAVWMDESCVGMLACSQPSGHMSVRNSAQNLLNAHFIHSERRGKRTNFSKNNNNQNRRRLFITFSISSLWRYAYCKGDTGKPFIPSIWFMTHHRSTAFRAWIFCWCGKIDTGRHNAVIEAAERHH